MHNNYSIAIDGPVAAGKGTIAPLLAKKINGFYLYTGAMYRCLALLCLEKNVDPNSEEKVLKLLPEVNIELKEKNVFLNGRDVTDRIAHADVARIVSIVSSYKKVRELMIKKQREIAEKIENTGKIVVAEGRDIGTKLFPNSPLKIFLTANQEVRAKRRLKQLRVLHNKIDLDQVVNDIKKRDKQDSQREIDPLTSQPEKDGYFVLDNSNLSEEETLKIIIDKLKEKGIIND